MILCGKNAFVLAMDLKGGGGVVVVGVQFIFLFFLIPSARPIAWIILACNTVSTAVKISYAIGQVTGTDYNWIKIQVYRGFFGFFLGVDMLCFKIYNRAMDYCVKEFSHTFELYH